ncbi:MAG TPA: iron ABC transporter permease [Bdellovibrionales bacterium]|nr:iron ABC transporter permease [Bdellovibrionales bacterium]
MKTAFSLTLLAALALIAASLSVGGSNVGMTELGAWITGQSLDEAALYILTDVRLPRTMACLVVGCGLGLSGALLQTLLKNPLAEPYTLGLSGGATLGAVLAILLRLQPAWLLIPFSAVGGCLLVTFFILKIAWRNTFYSQRTLILCGVMTSLFCGSLVVLLMTLFDPYQIQSSFFWMLGQMGSDRDRWWPLLLALLIGSTIWCLRSSADLDRLLLGEDIAASLGTKLAPLRISLIVIVALLCAMSVSISGLIGFVGLLAPHLALLLGPRQHRWHLPFSALMGGSFLLAADILARAIGGEREIPAGGIVALFGAPILVVLMLRWERHARA